MSPNYGVSEILASPNLTRYLASARLKFDVKQNGYGVASVFDEQRICRAYNFSTFQ
jgi:hypothetical protein